MENKIYTGRYSNNSVKVEMNKEQTFLNENFLGGKTLLYAEI